MCLHDESARGFAGAEVGLDGSGAERSVRRELYEVCVGGRACPYSTGVKAVGRVGMLAQHLSKEATADYLHAACNSVLNQSCLCSSSK